MSRKKDKRQVEHEECVETLPKVRKKQMIGENWDDEAEKTLERLVFGGETDALRELEKLENEVSVDDGSASEEVLVCPMNHLVCKMLITKIMSFSMAGLPKRQGPRISDSPATMKVAPGYFHRKIREK